jgi:N-acetylated-alpha-linked acidic dipeptidase
MDAAKQVDYPYSDKTLYGQWTGDKEEPRIGNLGGGSDHIAFYMHAGVPSLSGGAGGTSVYHSNYDDFHYYSKFVDPEFKMGPTIEKLVGIMSLRMANAELIPYDVQRYAQDLTIHFENATKKINEFNEGFKGFDQSKQSIKTLADKTAALVSKMDAVLASGTLTSKKVKSINKQLIALEKSFLEEKGMYFGAWYRSLYSASDPFSGYASWILPGLEYEIALKSSDRLKEWDDRYSTAIKRLNTKIDGLIGSID